MAMLFAPVVVMLAPASMSAATGGAEPALLTEMQRLGLAEVPGKVIVLAEPALSAWPEATQKSSPAALAAVAAPSVV